jgi:hypothetical protein
LCRLTLINRIEGNCFPHQAFATSKNQIDMKELVLVIALFFVGVRVSAQTAPGWEDNFDGNSLSSAWKKVSDAEGWPDKLTTLSVLNGNLVMEPSTSGWFADLNAPLLYQEVRGDFDVRARVRSSGKTGTLSKTPWSLGGLMVRVPKRYTRDNWQPKEETWLFLNTGVAHEPGKQVIESKYTLNSKSNLKLRDGRFEWITLRIVRAGHSFVLLYKYDQDKKWTVHERFYIADLPPVLQVGLNCYTNSQSVGADLGNPVLFNSTVYKDNGEADQRLEIDYIKLTKPKVSFQEAGNPMQTWFNNVYKNNLTDYSISNEELLKLLGD